jgi:hypothetical protein
MKTRQKISSHLKTLKTWLLTEISQVSKMYKSKDQMSHLQIIWLIHTLILKELSKMIMIKHLVLKTNLIKSTKCI